MDSQLYQWDLVKHQHTVKVISHVHNVVKILGHLLDGERLEVPETGRCGNRHGHSLGQLLLHRLEEFEIMGAVSLQSRRRARNINGLETKLAIHYAHGYW